MLAYVTRVLIGICILGVITFLIPDPDKTSSEKPDSQSRSIVRSHIAPLPRDLRIMDDVQFQPRAARRWRLDLVMPREESEDARPALLFVNRGRNASSFYKTGPAEFARKGYVCISLNSRLTHHASFASTLEDLKCAVRWLRVNAKKYQIDPNRIGGYGDSSGGHLVYLLGLMDQKEQSEGKGPWKEYSSQLNAICVSAAPTDFTHLQGRSRRFFRRSANSSATTWKERAAQISPISYVDDEVPPILVIHGAQDKRVDVSQADRIVEALKGTGAEDVTYYRNDTAGHSVFLWKKTETIPLMEEFFARTLGDRPPLKVAFR